MKKAILLLIALAALATAAAADTNQLDATDLLLKRKLKEAEARAQWEIDNTAYPLYVIPTNAPAVELPPIKIDTNGLRQAIAWGMSQKSLKFHREIALQALEPTEGITNQSVLRMVEGFNEEVRKRNAEILRIFDDALFTITNKTSKTTRQ